MEKETLRNWLLRVVLQSLPLNLRRHHLRRQSPCNRMERDREMRQAGLECAGTGWSGPGVRTGGRLLC